MNNFPKKKAIYCPQISNEGNAEWNETLANGESINGTCLELGFEGPISRECIQFGLIGNWSSITGSCVGYFSYSFSLSYFVMIFFFGFFFLLIKEVNQNELTNINTDVNECLTNNGGCHINANCTNTIGSFICECKTGYSGDGFDCEGIFFFFPLK